MKILLAVLVAAATANAEADWVPVRLNNLYRDVKGLPLPVPASPRANVDICSVTTLNDTSGTIISPNYPAKYSSNQDCSLTLEAPNDGNITVTCTEFHTELCCIGAPDYLKFTAADMTVTEKNAVVAVSTEYIMCGKYKGRDKPIVVTATGELTMRFKSNKKKEKTGFTCDYVMTDGNSGGGGGGGGDNSTFDACGVSGSSRILSVAHIAGGQMTEIEKFPWMAALNVCYSDGNCYHCSGTVISDTWVMTAAHCLRNNPVSVHVNLGGTAYNAPDVSIESTTFFIHPDWPGASGLENDIALIQLPSSITFSEKIRRVCLPSKTAHAGETFAGVTGEMTGWGYLGDSSTVLSLQLQEVTAPVMANSDCLWSPPPEDLCIDGSNAKSFCGGDSGGPMQIMQGDGTYMQIGILTYLATTGCELGYPGGSMRVTSYLDYIEQITGLSFP